jgi:hypothetical protein
MRIECIPQKLIEYSGLVHLSAKQDMQFSIQVNLDLLLILRYHTLDRCWCEGDMCEVKTLVWNPCLQETNYYKWHLTLQHITTTTWQYFLEIRHN